MANHQKPTREELEANIKKAQEELKTLPKPGEENKPTPSPSAPVPSPSEPVPSPSEPIPSPSPSEPVPSPSPSPSSPDGEDDDDEKESLKKKATSSAREAQVLHARTKKYDEAVDEADKVTEPDDDVMISEYGKDDWEGMSEGQKKMAKQTWVSNKRYEIMSSAAKEGREVQKWNADVDAFVENPKNLIKYPELDGKQEDFKLFAQKPTRRGLDFEDLVLAFNGELAKKPPKKNKGKQMPTGSAGTRNKQKNNDGTISAAQGRTLMKTDYKKYKQLLIAGKIRNK